MLLELLVSLPFVVSIMLFGISNPKRPPIGYEVPLVVSVISFLIWLLTLFYFVSHGQADQVGFNLLLLIVLCLLVVATYLIFYLIPRVRAKYKSQ